MVLNRILREDLERVASARLPWQDLSGCTVLVTGASGFLPAYMVESLLYLNDSLLSRPTRVVALVRNKAAAELRFARYLNRSDLLLVVQDVTVPLNYEGRIDYVIHAASQASPLFYKTDPAGTLSANVLGTFHLLELARQRNKEQSDGFRNFLFFSSGDVYGIVDPGLSSVAEHDFGWLDPTDVRSCYGESKRMGETMCVSWTHQFGLPTVIVRPFHTYGPGMRLNDGRVFADFVRDILAGGPITLHSDGSARRCFCYLADAVQGFFTVLLRGAAGQAWNVANPNADSSIAELAATLARSYATEGIRVERRDGGGDASYSASPIRATFPNIDKIRDLGWNPLTGIEEGFRRTVDSYRM